MPKKVKNVHMGGEKWLNSGFVATDGAIDFRESVPKDGKKAVFFKNGVFLKIEAEIGTVTVSSTRQFEKK